MATAGLVALLLILALSACAPGSEDPPAEPCPVSQFAEHAPEGADALPAAWHRNEEATLWVANLDLYDGRWYAGSQGMKVHWWRSHGSFSEDPLSIAGTLRGETSARLKARIPCCYEEEQITELEFPAAGCWQIAGRTRYAELSFWVQVEPEELHPLRRQRKVRGWPALESRANPARVGQRRIGGYGHEACRVGVKWIPSQ
jgi:hypothetical protein